MAIWLLQLLVGTITRKAAFTKLNFHLVLLQARPSTTTFQAPLTSITPFQAPLRRAFHQICSNLMTATMEISKSSLGPVLGELLEPTVPVAPSVLLENLMQTLPQLQRLHVLRVLQDLFHLLVLLLVHLGY